MEKHQCKYEKLLGTLEANSVSTKECVIRQEKTTNSFIKEIRQTCSSHTLDTQNNSQDISSIKPELKRAKKDIQTLFGKSKSNRIWSGGISTIISSAVNLAARIFG